MDAPRIKKVEHLYCYLYRALQLEHATIPVYLTALYSLKPQSNSDAAHILRVVAVEEMLHLTLAANVLNAVGGKPDLTRPDFVPTFPTPLPDGETDFTVDRQAFSRDALTTFLKIERPSKAPSENERVKMRAADSPFTLASCPLDPNVHFYSIGEFYEEIIRGLTYLDNEMKGKLFIGDPARQITSEYYYSGGGEVTAVTDLDSAKKALDLIIVQGEGFGGMITEKELAHYYRFQELQLGRYYLPGDEPNHPTGPGLEVDCMAVYPVKTNVSVDDLPAGSELRAAAVEFNHSYRDFLALLTQAFNGEPALLLEAVPWMFRLRNKFDRLIRNPIPGSGGLNAAPTFEMARIA